MSEELTMEKVVELLRDNEDTFSTMTGVKFNYYPQSLKKLEVALNEMFPFGERRVTPHISLIIGTYLGETIRRHLPKGKAVWKTDSEELFNSSLEIAVKADEGLSAELRPIIRADKFINYDRTDSLWAMYAMSQDLVKGHIHISRDMPMNQWQHNPRGYQYRVSNEEQWRKNHGQ